MSLVSTHKYKMDALSYQISVTIMNGKKQYNTVGVVDTGAAYCGITQDIIEALSLEGIADVPTKNADGTVTDSPVFRILLNVGVLDYRSVLAVKCGEGFDGSKVIIGNNFLKLCDLAITHTEDCSVLSLRFSQNNIIDFSK